MKCLSRFFCIFVFDNGTPHFGALDRVLHLLEKISPSPLSGGGGWPQVWTIESSPCREVISPRVNCQ